MVPTIAEDPFGSHHAKEDLSGFLVALAGCLAPVLSSSPEVTDCPHLSAGSMGQSSLLLDSGWVPLVSACSQLGLSQNGG